MATISILLREDLVVVVPGGSNIPSLFGGHERDDMAREILLQPRDQHCWRRVSVGEFLGELPAVMQDIPG